MSKRPLKLTSLADLGQWYQPRAEGPGADTPAAEGPSGADAPASEGPSGADAPAGEGHSEADASTKVEENPSAAVTPAADTATSDLAAILTELTSADDVLARLGSEDEAARARAHDLFERYDALEAATAEVERALVRARAVRGRASALVSGGFADETCTSAWRVARRAAEAEAWLVRHLEVRRQGIARFVAEHNLGRRLEVRSRLRAQEAEEAQAARSVSARRLAGALAAARKALAASDLKEARSLLGNAANENPGNPEITSLLAIIAQRELDGKTQAAEDALCRARHERQYGRYEPRAVTERMAALDLEELPRPLRRGVFGCWLEAGWRLCQRERYLDPQLYRPAEPGRGAIIARGKPGESYQVVCVLGMPDFPRPGSPIPPGALRRARPLR